MELNLNQVLKNLDGSDIISTPEKDEKKGKPLLFKTVCTNALLGAHQDEKNLSGDEKAKRGHLAMQIYATKGRIDLSIDGVKLLKDLIGKNPFPLIVSQAWDILDPPKKEVKKIPVKGSKNKK